MGRQAIVRRRIALVLGLLLITAAALGQDRPVPARGPLRVHPDNPRYFTDGSGRAVYLTGSHTWNNLLDMGQGQPPTPFDFDAYLTFLERYHHNFVRLWAWEATTWDTRANRGISANIVHDVAPQPWARTGPGQALDGKPKFDLGKFHEPYFERLRSRVLAARDRGIYVGIMLFEGWELMHANRGRAAPEGWAWRGHPFHPENNVSDVNADPDGDGLDLQVHRLTNPAVNAVQKAYIHKVIDSVNDLDNVLFEVINEGGEREWDWWVVDTVQAYERTKPHQHPVGITGHGAEGLQSMLASSADWISPGRKDGYGEDPPAWTGSGKVSLLDTDHIWGVGGNSAWVWKAFLRGHNPLFMDPYDNRLVFRGPAESWDEVRRSLGATRRVSERVRLARMTPADRLASTGYCLAERGQTYLVFVPDGGQVTIDLSETAGTFSAQWLHPVDASPVAGESVTGGGPRELACPRSGAAVLWLERSPRPSPEDRAKGL